MKNEDLVPQNCEEISSLNRFILINKAVNDCVKFSKIYYHITGSHACALMLQQMIYWHTPDNNGNRKQTIFKEGYWWVMKTPEDWWDECCLSEWDIRQCYGKLEKLGVVERKIFQSIEGDRALTRTHFRLIEDKLAELIEEQLKNISDKCKIQIEFPLLRIPQKQGRGFLKSKQIVYNTETTNTENKHARENALPQQGGAPPMTPASSSKKKQDKVNFREKVTLTQKEYDTLLEKNGKEFLNKMLDKLNAYKCSNGKTYESDYATMHDGGWVKKEIQKEIPNSKNEVSDLIKKRHEYCEGLERMFNSLDHNKKNGRSISVNYKHIEFCPGGNSATSVFVEYSDPNFKERINHEARKFGLIL